MAAVRTTLVSGIRSGMGRAVAALLRERGERVIGVDIAEAEIVADLSTPEGRRDAIAAAQEHSAGRLDAIIACAGLANADGPQVISVNYFGAVDLVAGLQPLIARSEHPRAVIIASSANMLPTDAALVQDCLDHREDAARERARDNPGAYASSKLAVTRWIRRTAIAPGWADAGLLLNGVAPGLVLTPMTAPILETEEGRAVLAASAPYATRTPAQAEDIAPLLAFLAGADNRYMVGQVPYCDGGKDVLLRGDDTLSPAPGFAD